MRPKILIFALLILASAVAAGGAYYLLSDEDPPEKRGSSAVEFDPSEPPSKKKRKVIAEAWPMFGYDVQRTKVGPFKHRPPYRTLWRVDGKDTFEFPASAAYGNVYIAQQKGLFFALRGKTGKPVFAVKDYKRCAASSPTLASRTIYQSYMHPVGDLGNPCPQGASNPRGFVVALNAKTGREKWRYEGQPFESSPLLRGGILYVGSWDGSVHAIKAKTGKRVWATATGNRVNTAGAYFKGRVYFGNQNGDLVALNAKTGKLAWKKSDATEFFYAAPAAAYGRIFIGSSDGTMYAYGARTGNLLWAKPLGSYIYSSAAIFQRKVYVGTYDGKFYALDAGTGDTAWEKEMPSAVHAPPSILDGLVYVSTCATCGSAAQRSVKTGVDSTTAFNARTGRQIWRNNAGKYAMPIIADQDRVYLTGRSIIYGLKPLQAKGAKGAKGKRGKRKRKR